MDKSLLLKGMILGMKQEGANFVKVEEPFIYFDVKIGSDIDDKEKLIKAKLAFYEAFGLGLKIRKIE